MSRNPSGGDSRTIWAELQALTAEEHRVCCQIVRPETIQLGGSRGRPATEGDGHLRHLVLRPVSRSPNARPNPPPATYAGPLFAVAHNWPTSPVPPPATPPWIAALKGQPISSKNALAYVEALKAYITPAMRTLIFDYAKWNGDSMGFYSSPWLAPDAEPIHGTYVGSGFPASTFPRSGLKGAMSTYVLTLYDKVAASTMSQLWGADALKFNGSGQMNTACPNNGSAGKVDGGDGPPVLTNVYLSQRRSGQAPGAPGPHAVERQV